MSHKWVAQPILLLSAHTICINNNRETHRHICIFIMWKPIKRTEQNRHSPECNGHTFCLQDRNWFHSHNPHFRQTCSAEKWVALLLIDNIPAYHRSLVFILLFTIHSFIHSHLCLVQIFVIPVQHCFGCIKWSSAGKEIFTHGEILKFRVVIPDTFCGVRFRHYTQCLVPHLKRQKQIWCYLTLRFISFMTAEQFFLLDS